MNNHKHIYDETHTCFECGKPASPSEHCKQYGLTLEQVSRATGVSRQTLGNWHKNKPRLFEVVLRGCIG